MPRRDLSPDRRTVTPRSNSSRRRSSSAQSGGAAASRAERIGGRIGHASPSVGSSHAIAQVGAGLVRSGVEVADVGDVGHDLEPVGHERREVQVRRARRRRARSARCAERRRPRAARRRRGRRPPRVRSARAWPRRRPPGRADPRSDAAASSATGCGGRSWSRAPARRHHARSSVRENHPRSSHDGRRREHDDAVDGRRQTGPPVTISRASTARHRVSHSELSSALSRIVSMHCQNPSWQKPAELAVAWRAARAARGPSRRRRGCSRRCRARARRTRR